MNRREIFALNAYIDFINFVGAVCLFLTIAQISTEKLVNVSNAILATKYKRVNALRQISSAKSMMDMANARTAELDTLYLETNVCEQCSSLVVDYSTL